MRTSCPFGQSLRTKKISRFAQKNSLSEGTRNFLSSFLCRVKSKKKNIPHSRSFLSKYVLKKSRENPVKHVVYTQVMHMYRCIHVCVRIYV